MPDDEALRAEARARLQAQLDVLTQAHPRRLAWYGEDDEGKESRDPADFRFLYDPTGFLVRAGREEDVHRELAEIFEMDDVPVPSPDDDPELAALELVRFPLPPRGRNGQDPGVLGALSFLDTVFQTPDDLDPDNPDDMARLVASPDHWVHVCRVGGRICPAVEPEVTTDTRPYPPVADDPTRGSGVRVTVVDSGWHPPAALDEDTTWLADVTGEKEKHENDLIERYAGHGTFVAGVVKCVAPAAEVHVEGFLRRAGAIREAKMVKQLTQALAGSSRPQIINLSAGTTTRKNRPLMSFERFHALVLSQLDEPCLLVAAAGNEAVGDRFWPASFGWAFGVGSLDQDGTLSDFSNFGDSAEIYAVGRDIVNAFPTGTYHTRETQPSQQRDFTTGLARWSGTSFSAPYVAGLIAAKLSEGAVPDVIAAKNAVRDSAASTTLHLKDPSAAPVTGRVLPIP